MEIFTEDSSSTNYLQKNETLDYPQSNISSDSFEITTPNETEKENINEIVNSFNYELEKTPTNLNIPEYFVNSSEQETARPILNSQNNNDLFTEMIYLTQKPQLICNNSETNLKKDEDKNLDKTVNIKEEDEEAVSFPSCEIEKLKETVEPNIPSCEAENLEKSPKSEIDLTESTIQFDIELNIKSENTDKKAPQLKIMLEKLCISNESHKKAIANLPQQVITLDKLDSRIVRKVNKFGFVKITSDLLKPLLPQCPKKKYPKGHYFHRLRNVVYEKDEFDKKFFHLALRRKANIDDKGKFLKFQCPTCPYKTWSFNGLSKHHAGLHGFKLDYTFYCPDCPFTFKNHSALTRHQQKHKKEPDLRCPHCPYITRFDVSLRVHLRRWHLPDDEAKTLKCTECNFRSVCKTTYEAHMRVHMKRGKKFLLRFVHKNNTTKILKCEYCNFQSGDKNGLRCHIQQTHKIENPFERELYRCQYCGFETVYHFSFQDHLKLHKSVDEVNFLCCYNCDFKTKWKKYLTLHMRTEHPRVKPEQKEIVYYHCAHCNKKFTTKFPLKEHIFKQHRESELFMCHYCNFTTKYMVILRKHTLRKHINPKKKIHQCQKCYLISKDRAAHKAHLRTHKIICYICGYEASSKTSVRYHIVGHMSKKEQKKLMKMYRCPCCEYESRNKHHYERHMKRWNHYPEKPFKGEVKEVFNVPTGKASDTELESKARELIGGKQGSVL